MIKKLSLNEKKVKAFYSGLGLLAIGFYLIFIKNYNAGFIPAIVGTLLLLWKW